VWSVKRKSTRREEEGSKKKELCGERTEGWRLLVNRHMVSYGEGRGGEVKRHEGVRGTKARGEVKLVRN